MFIQILKIVEVELQRCYKYGIQLKYYNDEILNQVLSNDCSYQLFKWTCALHNAIEKNEECCNESDRELYNEYKNNKSCDYTKFVNFLLVITKITESLSHKLENNNNTG